MIDDYIEGNVEFEYCFLRSHKTNFKTVIDNKPSKGRRHAEAVLKF